MKSSAHAHSVGFANKLVILGFGFIGQGVLPLIFRHIALHAKQILIITAEERGRAVADYYDVEFTIDTVTPDNYRQLLTTAVSRGDFLLNLSSDVESHCLIELCGELGVLYLDTCIDSWLGESTDASLSVSRRSLYALREQALALRKKRASTDSHMGTTAVLAHGANPGIVSHLVKQALLNIARDNGIDHAVPVTRENWARLAQRLAIKVIHIAERDTQWPAERKASGEFVNTLGIGMGRENAGNRHRRSAHFSAEGEIGSISGYFEDGASGQSHKVFLNYWLTNSLGIGLMDDDLGRGPRVVYRLGEKANLWGALLRDRSNGATTSFAAVNYQF